MLNYIKAFIMMFRAHWGQKDKGSHPYFMHPLRVSKKVVDKRAKVVALLHDVLEDSNKYRLEDFSFLDAEQKEALILLTHKKDVDYFEYITKIKSNDLATKVKLMDLEDNMNLSRLKVITDKDRERLRKYKKAKLILEQAL